ncbi:hypothetical protein MOQ72_08435 [Saccharopolyspora sp. K220]|uniref:VC0807 family protein n=1 Tax=Saccharopolyspora soli TaxID=2926618 RepID=UPI001F570593|nr:VC0807 family protein [Saccharopolyspora soli]MCI2417450.1 hypothetical protein [Saccharopolyspora soli]
MNRSATLKGIIADIGLPIVAYWACRSAFGLSEEVSLAVGGVVAVGRALFVAVARRRFNGLAAFLAAGMVVSLLLTLVTGNPRLMLAKESVDLGLLGLLALGSCLVGRPLMYALMRRLNVADEAKLARWDHLWQTAPPFRRVFVTLTAVWGSGLLFVSIVRIPLIYSLSVDAMTIVSPVLQWGTIAALIGWSRLYRNQRKRKAAVAMAAPGRRG